MSRLDWTPECEAIARSVAKHYYVTGGDEDDVIQEARIGVLEALEDFDGSRGAGFPGFARLCATRKVLTAVITARRDKHRILNDACSPSRDSAS